MAQHRINVTGIVAVEFVDAQSKVDAPDGTFAPMPANKPYIVPEGMTEMLIDPGGKVRAMTAGRYHIGGGGALLQGFAMNKVLTSEAV